jgi:hypothetical protein
VNLIQRLFYVDGRMKSEDEIRKRAKTILYSLLDWRQLKYVFSWWASLQGKRNPWDDGSPWVTYRAIEFMDRIITKDTHVFEYGSGGSTLYFSENAKHVTSVEHHKDWYKVVMGSLKRRKVKNCEYLLCEPEERSKYEYFRSTTDPTSSYREYVTSINKFEDNFFDFISVDGRARVQCVIEALPKLKSGGYLLLDNSERCDYFEVEMMMRRMGAVEHRFFGLVGYESPLAQTTIWQVNKT